MLDEDGKELARGGSYKVTELQDVQEGQLIPVGGKEIEITGTLDEEDWLSKVVVIMTAFTVKELL